MTQDQAQVNDLHGLINDAYLDIVDVRVYDDHSRDARQRAITRLVRVRRLIDQMGMVHRTVEDPAQSHETGTARRAPTGG